jgi:hypothetical protein
VTCASRTASTSTPGSWTRWSREGFIVLGGPLAGEREILHAVFAPSQDAVQERLAEDNWHRNGMLTITSIEPWTVLLDGRTG